MIRTKPQQNSPKLSQSSSSRWLKLREEDRSRSINEGNTIDRSTRLYEAVRRLRKAHFGIAAMLADRVEDAEQDNTLRNASTSKSLTLLCQATFDTMTVLLEDDVIRSLWNSTRLVSEGYVLVFQSLPILVKYHFQFIKCCTINNYCEKCLGCLFRILTRSLDDVLDDGLSGNRAFYLQFIQRREPDSLQLSSKPYFLSDSQIVTCYSSLMGCLGTEEATLSQLHRLEIVYFLAFFIRPESFLDALNAETVAQKIVMSMFLPCLEYIDNGSNTDIPVFRQKGGFSGIKCVIVETINALLKNQKHSSAMIAPLVIDISSEGDEKLRTNPIKVKLICVLQTLLFRTNFKSEADVVTKLAQCLNTLIDADISLSNKNIYNESKINMRSMKSLNVIGMLRHIYEILQKSRRQYEEHCLVATLSLLAKLAKAFPQETSSQWHLFLSEANWNALATSFTSPVPVEFVYNRYSDQIRICAINSIICIVESIPLRLWMGRLSKSNRTHKMSARYIGDRISSVLATLMDVFTYEISKGLTEEVLDVVLTFVELALRKIPFENNEKVCLSAALRLVNACFRLHWDEVKHTISTKDKRIVETIVNLYAGVESKQGHIIPIPLPVMLWLDRYPFYVQAIEDSVLTDDFSVSNLMDRFELLGALYRAAPWLVDSRRFMDLFSCNMTSLEVSRTRQGIMKVLVKLLLGRKRNMNSLRVQQKNWNFILNQVFPILHDILNDHRADVDIAMLCIQSFGLLEGPELVNMLNVQVQPEHIESLLCWCSIQKVNDKNTTKKNKTKIIATTLTALGDIIATLHESNTQKDLNNRAEELKRVVRLFSDDILLGLSPGTDDLIRSKVSYFQHSFVFLSLFDKAFYFAFCKALYAVGNMALVVADGGGDDYIVDVNTYHQFVSISVSTLSEENEKLVSAGIRAIGHLCFGYFRTSSSQRYPCLNNLSKPMIALYFASIDHMMRKIQMSLDISSNEIKGLTWKRKSQIIKHARGSCHSLLHIIQSCHYDESLLIFTRPTVFILLECIRPALYPNLHPKVSTAAMNTLLLVDWCIYKKEEKVLPSTMLNCLLTIQEVSSLEFIKCSK